jgi:acetyl-CoA carboxylase carboxyl transferase subunit beta
MAWFKKSKEIKTDKKVKIPEGLWVKCESCREIIYKKEIDKNLKICPKCNYHFRISALERLKLLVDEGSFVEMDPGLSSIDPLKFKDKVLYKEKLEENKRKTGLEDAAISGQAEVEGHPVNFVIMDFAFIGGSMARVSAAIGRLRENGLLYISVLADPTFGGVTASFAMLGDVIIAEPKSLIGFAGRGVIEQTIKQQLPEDFQRAEFLLEHGFIDKIVDRKDIKKTIAKIIELLS